MILRRLLSLEKFDNRVQSDTRLNTFELSIVCSLSLIFTEIGQSMVGSQVIYLLHSTDKGILSNVHGLLYKLQSPF